MLKRASECLGITKAHGQWVFGALKHQGLIHCLQITQFPFPFPVHYDSGVLHIVLDIIVEKVVI